jgi:large subunit ribosomal protein L23
MSATAAATDIVKRPLITEKSTWEGQSRNRYAFEVAMGARKAQIKEAVQSLYGVRVQSVATQVRKGEEFRTRQGKTRVRSSWKKAVVEVHPEDKIDLF